MGLASLSVCMGVAVHLGAWRQLEFKKTDNAHSVRYR